MQPAIWCWDDHLRCWKKLIIYLNRTLRKQATGWRYQWKDLNSKYLSLTLVFNILILLFDKRCPAKLTNTWYGCIKPHCFCTRQRWTPAYTDNISRKLCYLWYSLDSWFVSQLLFLYNAHSHIQKTRYWSCVFMFTAWEPSKLVLDVLGHSSNRSLHDGSLETNTFEGNLLTKTVSRNVVLPDFCKPTKATLVSSLKNAFFIQSIHIFAFEHGCKQNDTGNVAQLLFPDDTASSKYRRNLEATFSALTKQ